MIKVDDRGNTEGLKDTLKEPMALNTSSQNGLSFPAYSPRDQYLVTRLTGILQLQRLLKIGLTAFFIAAGLFLVFACFILLDPFCSLSLLASSFLFLVFACVLQRCIKVWCGRCVTRRIGPLPFGFP